MSRKIVILTPELNRTYRDTARKQRFQLRGNRRFSIDIGERPVWPCRIIAATPIAGATATIGGVSQAIRFSYTLKRVRWDPTTEENVDMDLADIEGATNMCEDGNDGTAVGPGYLCANVPAGLEYCPAGYAAGGYLITGLTVPAWAEIADDGTVSWRFYHANTFDGECS